MNRAATISLLKKELASLQGIGTTYSAELTRALWFLKHAFPGHHFPLGSVHEFLAFTAEDIAATKGFINALLSQLINDKQMAVWISRQGNHYPVAMPAYNLSPDNILFVKHHNEKELLWVVEEFLKYDQLSVLVAELKSLDFTASRRFQLAVEKSKVTAFVLRTDASKIIPNSSVSRWQIKSIPSVAVDGLPGVGFPAWDVDLQRMRNGKPARVNIEYRYGKLALLEKAEGVIIHPNKKAAG